MALPGQAAAELASCADTQDGTCWEGELTLPELDEYALTIRGKDVAGNSLLPFADWEPKTLSDWTASATDVGDTVHWLGVFTKIVWRMTTPQDSFCYSEHGGVTCAYGTQKGLVSLSPAGPLEWDWEPVVMLSADDTVGTTHEGSYTVPPDTLKLTVQPSSDHLCSGSETVTGDDPSTLICSPPPARAANDDELTWRVTTSMSPSDNACQIQVTIGDEDILLELSPRSACAHITEETGTVPVTTTCGWTLTETSYDWLGPTEYVDQEQAYLQWPRITAAQLADVPWPNLNFDCDELNRLRPTGCQPNPHWQHPFTEVEFSPIAPDEEGFSPEQLIRIQYTELSDWHEWRVKNCFGKSGHACLDIVTDAGGVLMQGAFRTFGDLTLTYFIWHGLQECLYTQIARDTVFPNGSLTIPLDGEHRTD